MADAAAGTGVVFTDAHKAQVQRIFGVLDSEGHGKLTYSDIFALLRALMLNEGVSSSDAAIEHGCRKGFEAIDTDGDGFITSDELGAFIRSSYFEGGESEADITAKLDALCESYEEAVDIPRPPPLDAHPDDIPPPPAAAVDEGLNSDVDGDEDEEPADGN